MMELSMDQKLPEEDAIRQYLLGTLDEARSDALEQKLLDSEELSEIAGVIEDEIIEQYLDDELDEREKQAVETHFLRPQEHQRKMRFAATLKGRLQRGSTRPPAKLDPTQFVPVPPRPSSWNYGGLAAAVVLGSVSMYLGVAQKDLKKTVAETRNAQASLQAELTQERERSAGLEEKLRSFETSSGGTLDLQPGVIRGTGVVPKITLRPALQTVRIELVLPSASSAPVRVRLLHNGTEVWSETGLKPVPTGTLSTLSLDVRVASGAYDLVVNPEGNPSHQDVYPFDAKIAQ
jgi:hypothetical protein